MPIDGMPIVDLKLQSNQSNAASLKLSGDEDAYIE